MPSHPTAAGKAKKTMDKKATVDKPDFLDGKEGKMEKWGKMEKPGKMEKMEKEKAFKAVKGFQDGGDFGRGFWTHFHTVWRELIRFFSSRKLTNSTDVKKTCPPTRLSEIIE